MSLLEDLADKNKCVAFLDVLGFKELVENASQRPRLKAYFDLIGGVVEGVQRDSHHSTEGEIDLQYQLISDSTILSCPFTTAGLRILLKAVQEIQTKCCLVNIWLRGAISCGAIHFDKVTNIVVGEGLSEAYLLESQEKFPRIIIDPRIIQSEIFGTRAAFINSYNDPRVSNRVPLIHQMRQGIRTPSSQDKYIENDILFIAFCEKIAFDSVDDLQIVYENIRRELYSGMQNYQKYFWLKNYFVQALVTLDAGYYNALGPHGQDTVQSPENIIWKEQLRKYCTMFKNL